MLTTATGIRREHYCPASYRHDPEGSLHTGVALQCVARSESERPPSMEFPLPVTERSRTRRKKAMPTRRPTKESIRCMWHRREGKRHLAPYTRRYYVLSLTST